MLTFSLGNTDQNGFQARIKSKKLGLAGDVETDSSEDISRKVRVLLDDQDIKLSLRKMKSGFDIYEKEKVFEKLELS